MRSPAELKRAASLLIGAETMFEQNDQIMPTLPQSQMTLLYLTLQWAWGEDNLISELIAGIEEATYLSGIGVSEDGKPYPLTPTVVQ